MPNAFDAANAPFDRLTSQEVETLRAALDIGYFRPGETIIAQNAVWACEAGGPRAPPAGPSTQHTGRHPLKAIPKSPAKT